VKDQNKPAETQRCSPARTVTSHCYSARISE